MINYKTYSDLNNSQKNKVNQIFFQNSSVNKFEDLKSKDAFFYKYLGHYQQNYPDLLITIMEDSTVLGYICGSSDSQNDKILYELVNYYNLFSDYFNDYPAHLHINISQKFTGKGLGGLLLSRFERKLTQLNCKGVHLVTGVDSRNISFYRKNGYGFAVERKFKSTPLLFLSKSLSV